MAVYTETVKLDDQISKAAAAAANEAKVLDGAVKSVQNSLIKAQATGNINGFKKASQQLGMLKIASEQANTKLAEFPKTTDDASSGMTAMQGELAALTGGLSVAIEIIGAVVVGFAALTLAGMAFAISSNSAKKQMISMFDAMGQGKVTGEQVDNMLSDLSDRIKISKDELIPYTQAFLQMGVTGVDALEKLTLAAISANAIVGSDKGAKAFEDLTKKIQVAAQTGAQFEVKDKVLKSFGDMGLTIDEVAAKMGMTAAQLKGASVDAKKLGAAMSDALIAKGAKPLDQLSSSFDNIKKKFMQDIGDMFEDIDVGPFMAEVKELFGIFSQAKPSGQALKSGIGGFFKEVFALATKVVPMVKHFLLDVVIYGLKAYIALKPMIAWFKEVQKNESVMNALKMAFEGIKTAVVVLAVVLAVIIGIFVGVWAIGAALGVMFWTLAAAVNNFATASATALVEWVANAWKCATDFISGLVNGIENGKGMVVEAVKGLGTSALNGFKGVLGIASPSKVMMQMGEYTGEGAAQGIQSSSKEVAAAASDMGGAAAGNFAAGSSSSGSSSGGSGVTVTVEPGAIVIQGGSGQGVLELTEQAVMLIFERIALARGL